MSDNQKRREDACALPESGRCRTMLNKRLDEFRTQCFWSAMRHRIAFLSPRKDEESIDKGSKHQMHESRVDSRPTFSKGQGIFW
jgi:hypothetical protein